MRWLQLALISVAELLAMSLWFSASAVVPQLAREWGLQGAGVAWLTISVQLGFVAGGLIAAFANLADRIANHTLCAVCTLGAAAANAAITLADGGFAIAIALRVLTGAFLAGVYPPGMRLVASWTVRERGFALGVLVGALALGSGFPHLLNAWVGDAGLPPWRTVLRLGSLAAAAGAVILATGVRSGPHLPRAAPFDWRFAPRVLRERSLRLATFGYLGHMWELYAMWTWVPLLLVQRYAAAGWSPSTARAAGFATLGAGALGCVLAGWLADRVGRTAVVIASLVVSGSCCLIAGWTLSSPAWLTAVCIVWGFAVVADSAQFSAAVTELADPRYVGTTLTMQTCLGFLLTAVTIGLVPAIERGLGWGVALAVLGVGPALGVASMLRLRRLPEALALAGGRR
jgi:MFS family permease